MLSYIGGKSKIGKWIVPFYDKNMETYLETFGGMFWCFYNMDLKQFPNLNKVVYNDFNPLNHNLFKCVQNPTELLRSINSIDCQKFGNEVTPEIYREQFVSFQSELFKEGFKIDGIDYDAAAKYVYVLTQVFSGSKPETSKFIVLIVFLFLKFFDCLVIRLTFVVVVVVVSIGRSVSGGGGSHDRIL